LQLYTWYVPADAVDGSARATAAASTAIRFIAESDTR
jgi:hypothetical protein